MPIKTTEISNILSAATLIAGLVVSALILSPMMGNAAPTEVIQQPTSLADSKLVEVKEGEKLGGSIATFNFGVAEQMDNRQSTEDTLKQINFEHVLPGLKHIFTFKNTGAKDITIESMQSESHAFQAEVVANGKEKDLPYVVKAGAKVKIRMAFDYYFVYPGPARAQVDLYQRGSKKPLASLVMDGRVKGGIEFSEKQIDFGEVQPGFHHRDFTLTFDKRMPDAMIPVPLKLVSQNPYIKIKSLEPQKEKMGVKIQGDSIVFPAELNNFSKDLQLKFRAELSSSSPVGPINGEIALIMVGAPYAAVTRDVKARIKGNVFGHLKATPLRTLALATTESGVMKQATTIVCHGPIKAENLRVKIDNPNFKVRLLPIVKNDSEQPSVVISGGINPNSVLLEGEEAMILEVTLDPQNLKGNLSGKAIISNTINDERLELPVHAKILPKK